MRESDLLNKVIRAVHEQGNVIFRVNVGSVVTNTGRRFSTGVPKGFSDLFGIRADGKAFFIECKVKPNKPTKEQEAFLDKVASSGALAGVAYSVEDALGIVWEDL